MKSVKTKIIRASVFFSFISLLVFIILVRLCLEKVSERESNLVFEYICMKKISLVDSSLMDVQQSAAYMASLLTYMRSFDEESVNKFFASFTENIKYCDENIRACYFRILSEENPLSQSPLINDYYYKKGASSFVKNLPPKVLYNIDESFCKTKTSSWLKTYRDKEGEERLISYVHCIEGENTPCRFVGVELNADCLFKHVENSIPYDTGALVVFDGSDNIFYEKNNKNGLIHNLFTKDKLDLLKASNKSLNRGSAVICRIGKKTEKVFSARLINGMTLCVFAPINVCSFFYRKVFLGLLITSIIVFILSGVFFYFSVSSFIRPLSLLAGNCKKLSEGKFDFNILCSGDDEACHISKTLDVMKKSLSCYHTHFHGLAYTDSITSFNNKRALKNASNVIDSEVEMRRASFTIIVMTIDNLKSIGDSLGMEKQNDFLKSACRCMRNVFVGFPLYRIDDNEFCTIINNSNPVVLIEQLQIEVEKIFCREFKSFSSLCKISAGSSTYDKVFDRSFSDVFNRAEAEMYKNSKGTLKECV